MLCTIHFDYIHIRTYKQENLNNIFATYIQLHHAARLTSSTTSTAALLLPPSVSSGASFRQALGLREEEVDDREVARQHAAPHNVVPPLDRVQRDRVDEPAEQVRPCVTELLQHLRLRPQSVRADLHVVRLLRRRRHLVERAEEEDHGDCRAAEPRIREVVALVDTRAHRQQQIRHEHACHAAQEHHPAPQPVDHQREEDAEHEPLDRVPPVDQQLRLGPRHADRVQHQMQVVRHQRVAAPLDHEPQTQDDEEPVAIRRRAEPLQPRRPRLALLLLQRVVDLRQLELQQRRVLVPVCVVFRQDPLRLLPPVVEHQPPRRLGHDERHDDLEDGRDGLQQTGQAPAPRRRHERRAVRDPRRQDLAQRPRRVQNASDLRPLRRIGQLRDQDRTGRLLYVVAEADQHTAYDEHGHIGRGRLQRDADEHDGRPDGDGLLATEPLDQRVDDEQRRRLPNARAVGDQPQPRALGVPEVVLPLWDDLQPVEHRPVVAVGHVRRDAAEQQ
ncbi:hypothetical protein T310_5774 [Rasamsonia emersonii CBS 393.64]|uniref:Uncharacterized protein n=1 Tax=Rasamsonia emersonii (strain ATCC 16479 / CBS 393.64 / IMI 116815) TaxID=1408163 RepID=A0A0F4YQ44_RASE3|nr:hypothetical protein T310_5774 [Rasamsonia emersonii CBS 393.64]KKA20205.1 hypothetical protein T310_5774 [Rasamsonia emersonii CBS 393.64]